MRPSNRAFDEARVITFLADYTCHAEGSVLSCFGNTKVLCTATVEERIPPFLKGKEQGWVTAEYGMLPRATHTRSLREAAKGKQTGRTQEIQRLIGRSLRAAVNLKSLGERTITIDCDVLQADGGTRTAAISGGFVALSLAINKLLQQKIITVNPIVQQIAAVSVGIYQNTPVVDLDYAEDSAADTDMNVVMNDQGAFIEVQATAEGMSFSNLQLNQMLQYAEQAINQIFLEQRRVLEC